MKKILFAIVLMCPLATWAQDIKPFDAKVGLWESTTTTEISGMPAMPATPAMPALTEEQLAKIPPAQRAQVEAMMKGRGSSAGSPRTTTSKYCLTRESLNRAQYNSEKNCTTKLVNSSAGHQQIHVECATGNTRSTGDVSMERVDAEHGKGTVVMKVSSTDGNAAGRSMDIKASVSNKWISADCGDIKPIGEK